MLTESVVVALDGEAKCGKTTIINAIRNEALHQADIAPGILDDPEWQPILSEESRTRLEVLATDFSFHAVSTLSAGNSFRAAALYRALRELNGDPIEQFVDADYERIAEILAIEGIEKILQTDRNIEMLVSPTGVLPGAQEVCSALFCDQFIKAYELDGKSNLIIVDARSPIDHLRRADRLGPALGQIAANHILPIYIDTPPEVAAARISSSKDDYEESLALINNRRLLDRTREVAPVRIPESMIHSYPEWQSLVLTNQDANTTTEQYRLENGAGVTLDNIRHVAGEIAGTAHDLAAVLSDLRRKTTAVAS